MMMEQPPRPPRRPRRRRRRKALSKAMYVLCCVAAASFAAAARGFGIALAAAAAAAAAPEAESEAEEDASHDDPNDMIASSSLSQESASPAPAPDVLEDLFLLGDSSDDDDEEVSDEEDSDDEEEDDLASVQRKLRRFWHPPANVYKYDSLVLDPISMYGSPLGGFSRDVTSRLSSLPLFLPSSSQDIAPPQDDDDDPVHYLHVRDAHGQLFACRVHHQDELDPASLDDGMFELARLSERNVVLVKAGDDGDAVGALSSSSSTSTSTSTAQTTTTPSGGGVGSEEARGGAGGGGAGATTADNPPAAGGAKTGRGVTLRDRPENDNDKGDESVEAVTSGNDQVEPRAGAAEGSRTVVEVRADGGTATVADSTASGVTKDRPHVGEAALEGSDDGDDDDDDTAGAESASPRAPFTQEDVEERLAPLEGVCVHIHLGWWSTEWCYKASVRQFHVHVEQKDASKLPHQVEITDVTQLGQFERRRVEIVPTRANEEAGSPGGNANLPPNPLAGRQAEVARVLDVHSDGDKCDATGQSRSTLVQLLCCSGEVMDGARQFPIPTDAADPSAFPPVALYGVYEDPDKLCNYVVTVCTSLLCDGSASSLTPVNKLTRDATSSPGTGGGATRRAKTTKAPGDDDSIRGILDLTLGERCLDVSTDGWWSYSYCHGDRITQYHEVLEAKKSRPGVHVAERRVEAEHLLGVYQPDVAEAYPNHEEWKHVVNATEKRSRGGGTGTYFEVEYTHGDVCDHSDVTDAAIIAGGAAGGAAGGVIARASTVRFFCGKAYQLAVSEDSTCHYIVEVTVPALCQHPVFKEPIMKRQVVKCLPVDEDDPPSTGDEATPE